MSLRKQLAPAAAVLTANLLILTTPVSAQVSTAPSAGSLVGDAPSNSIDVAQALQQSSSPSQPSPGNGGSASGISTNPSNNTTGQLGTAGVPLPLSGPPRIGLFPAFGQTLLSDGIDIHGIAFDHFLSNTTAGNIPGNTYNLGLISPAIDVDLGKLAGVTGGNVHFQMTFFGVRSNIPPIITEAGGWLTGFQTTPAPSTSSVILSVLTYEQKLFSDKLSLEVGRTNVYHYFLLPNGLDFFNDFSSTFNVDGDFNSNPFPVWGGRATYHFTKQWYVQGGAFEDNYYRAINNPDNFGTDAASGAQILGELAYRSEFSNAQYPANFELGFEWNTRHGYFNTKGGAVLATPRNTATDYSGGGVAFFEGQKVLWRGPRNPFGPPANIAIYGSADASVSKPQPIDEDALVGMNFTGLIPGRPFDALGLQAHYQRLSGIEANYESLVQTIFAGPGRSQSRNNYAFEVIGNILLAPWLELDPTVQYFVNPDNLFDPAQRRRPSDGFEAGLFAIVPLGLLLGTSNKPF